MLFTSSCIIAVIKLLQVKNLMSKNSRKSLWFLVMNIIYFLKLFWMECFQF